MKKEEKPFLSGNEAANKEAILRNILDSAESAATGILANAGAECARLLADAQADIALQRDENFKKAAAKAEDIKQRKNLAVKMECKKYELAEKQNLIEKVYEAAQKTFSGMSADEYKNFYATMIADVADCGDEVLLSQSESRLDAAWLNEINKKTNKALKLSQNFHSDGGVILRGKICDKNLTHSVLVKEAREKTESEIIKRLFE